jgi:hypothetical protein
MHYAGSLEYTRADGHGVSIMAGCAACASGAKTIRLRDDGRVTKDGEAVTCKRCLNLMRLADAR